jgi:uncharacterized membrane protein
VDGWLAIRFLHLIALAFFVGGQLFLVAAVVPAMRGEEDGRMRSIARRFGMATLVALAVLVATGIAMADHYGRWGEDVLNAKLAVLVVVGVLLVFHMITPRSRALSAAMLLASLLVVWLGVDLAH